jgi:hypothetical protein
MNQKEHWSICTCSKTQTILHIFPFTTIKV